MESIKRGHPDYVPKTKRIWALYRNDELIADGTYEEIARQTGLNLSTLRHLTSPHYVNKRVNNPNGGNCMMLVDLEEISKKDVAIGYRKVYDLFKGNEVIASGTIGDIAEQLGIKPKSVYNYRCEWYKARNSEENRRVLVAREDVQ